MAAEPTLADVLVELRELRAEVRELRQQNTQPTPARLVDANTLARELNVTRWWVYQHRDELGVVSLGDGPRARLRFDLDAARRGYQSTTAPAHKQTTGASSRRARRAKRARSSVFNVREP